jgi:hypothetical protein
MELVSDPAAVAAEQVRQAATIHQAQAELVETELLT